MSEEQSAESFWRRLAGNVETREGGTERAFDIETDPCKFWKEIHGKGYADGLRPARIAEFVAPLWLHHISTLDDLFKRCCSNYDEAKAALFQNDSGAIRFFERHFLRVDVTLKYSGGISHQLKNIAATVDAIKAGVRGRQGGKFEIADFALLDPNGIEVRENSDLARLTSPWVLSVKSIIRVDVTLKFYGGVSHQLKNIAATVDAIRAGVRGRQVGKFEIADFALLDPNGIEVKENSDLSRLTSPWVLSVKSNQIEFSKVPDLGTALKMCGENTAHQANLPVEQFMTDAVATTIKADSNFGTELEHAWGTIERLHKVHPNDYGNETTTRSYINPIVIAAAMLSEGITFVEEVKIEGPYGIGPVDYAFKYKDTIVCITEVKDHDMHHGLRQNIAQLAATRSDRKRTFAAMNDDKKFTYYGIATTTYFWQLIELKGDIVKSSALIDGCYNEPEKERISGLIAHVVNLLDKCKKNYDDAVDAAAK